MPYINAYRMADKTVYLLANGSMLNLTAGFGDSLNAFDVTGGDGQRHPSYCHRRHARPGEGLSPALWQQAL